MLRNTTLFFVGAFGYGQIELLYRGYTHWTMLAAGGVILLVLRGQVMASSENSCPAMVIFRLKTIPPLWAAGGRLVKPETL